MMPLWWKQWWCGHGWIEVRVAATEKQLALFKERRSPVQDCPSPSTTSKLDVAVVCNRCGKTWETFILW